MGHAQGDLQERQVEFPACQSLPNPRKPAHQARSTDQALSLVVFQTIFLHQAGPKRGASVKELSSIHLDDAFELEDESLLLLDQQIVESRRNLRKMSHAWPSREPDPGRVAFSEKTEATREARAMKREKSLHGVTEIFSFPTPLFLPRTRGHSRSGASPRRDRTRPALPPQASVPFPHPRLRAATVPQCKNYLPLVTPPFPVTIPFICKTKLTSESGP
jgi:hypothetical protein